MVQFFGILNLTPDSFSDGGQFDAPAAALAQAQTLIAQGADFLDVGGESTRPGATTISVQDEWDRVGGILEILLENYPGKISLDTRNVSTAIKFLKLGGTIINDVSGFQNPEMIQALVKYGGQGIVNHFPGKSIEEVHDQAIDSMDQVEDELMAKKTQMLKTGVKADQIILDPGIGFGKTMELNWELLEFPRLLPAEHILIGHSRKRFLGEDRLEALPNITAGRMAIEAGAQYLRVHEVNIYKK